MGGRGIHVKNSNSQVNLDRYLLRNRILEIHNTAKELRKNIAKNKAFIGQTSGGGAAARPRYAKKRCACCGCFSLPAYTQFETCEICGWIDDPNQNLNQNLEEGANPISLSEARQRWREKAKKG